MRQLASFLFANLCGTGLAGAAPVDDPTFNGTIVGAECYVRTMTMCGGDFCQQVLGPCIGDHCGTLHIKVARGAYNLDGSPDQPLQFLDTSKAKIGKELWLKYKVDLRGKATNLAVTLTPSPGGGYTTTAVGLFRIEGQNGAKASVVENFECERYSAGE